MNKSEISSLMVNAETYLKNPCRVSSIPYWKAKSISVPAGMKILHETEFHAAEFPEISGTDSREVKASQYFEASKYVDEPYFRLCHELKNVEKPLLPRGFSLCNADFGDYAEHINQCYEGIRIREADLQEYLTRPVFDASL